MQLNDLKESLTSKTNEFLARGKHRMLIGGQWVDAAGGQTLTVLNPASEEVIATVAAGQQSDVDAAVAAARKAFDGGPWSRMKPAERERLLLRLAMKAEKPKDTQTEVELMTAGQ